MKIRTMGSTRYLLTFALSRMLIPQNIYLMHSTVFGEHNFKLFFVHGAWYLTDKHFNIIGVRLVLRSRTIHFPENIIIFSKLYEGKVGRCRVGR